MKTTKLFAGIAPALALGGMLMGSTTALGNQQAPTTGASPEITSITVANEGGGLSPYLSPSCAVVVNFSDATPSASTAYTVTVADSYDVKVGTFAQASLADGGDSQFRVGVPCDSIYEDEALTYVVNEGDSQSAAKPFTFSYVGHPTGIEDSSVLRNGEWTHFVGKKATVKFTGGSWEPGTKFSSRVWTSKTKNFTPADFAANTSGNAAIVQRDGAGAPVLTWTPRQQDAGKYVWVSIRGEKAGKGDWQFYFDAQKVAALPKQPAKWVKKFGKITGKVKGHPKVGRKLSVSKPVFTKAGKAHKATVRYQWSYGTATTIKGATKRTFKPKRALRGQKLRLTVTVRAEDYADRTKVYNVGRVR
ncbi:hypothetical protein [Nocardioides soli]|uniref:Uncharacterized protein n=1 Tax=Nocardioides soli TaxID=1036020 RepID=A0A7W4VTA8_9ACTN|nr:hypothetical protein [Nocardioides soli]MBB3041376.1 hypothetical protein [Nocardioides soli]